MPTHFSCPLYSSRLRGLEHHLMNVDLKTEDAPAKWVLRGVCLLTRAG